MPLIPFIRFPADQDAGLDLRRAKVHFSCPYVKVPDRDPAYPFRSGQLDHRIPGEKRRGRVSGRNAVACISPDSPDISDLGASYHIYRLTQDSDVFPDQRIFSDMGKTRKGADPYRPILLHAHAAQLIQSVDAHQLGSCPFSFPHLHQYIAPSGDNLGLRMLLKEPDGMFNASRFIQSFHIIHSLSPPNNPSLRSNLSIQTSPFKPLSDQSRFFKLFK